jgi:hypothetical protein
MLGNHRFMTLRTSQADVDERSWTQDMCYSDMAKDITIDEANRCAFLGNNSKHCRWCFRFQSTEKCRIRARSCRFLVFAIISTSAVPHC